MSLIDALLLDPAPFEVWISNRGDQKGSGTLNDPWDGSTTAKFDAIMNSLASLASPNTLVHLGPGIFTTAGYKDASTSAGWQIQPGMRIVGSGIGATTLKLDASGSDRFYAIGHDLGAAAPRDLCGVANLTIDCNLPNSGTQACGAVRLMGNHIRIRNVRAINWGARSGGPTCFVFAAISGDIITGNSVPTQPTDVGIEGCIADLPSINHTGKVNVFHVGGSRDSVTVKEAFGQAPFIRNCYADGFITGNPPPDPLATEIRALSMNWCKGGVVEGNQLQNIKIGGPFIENASSRDLIIRANTYKNVNRGPWCKLAIPSGDTGGTGSLSRSGSVATLTMTSNHDLTTGDRVRIDSTTDAFDGVYLIEVTGDKVFTITVPDSGATMATMAPVPDDPNAADSTKLHKNGLEKGDGIQILNAGIWNDIANSKFNGFFTVVNIPTDSTFPGSQFEYDLEENPGTPTPDYSPGYFSLVWGPKRLVIENNVIELGLRQLPPEGRLFSRGISLIAGRLPLGEALPSGTISKPPYLGQIIMRGNVIRRVNNTILLDAHSVGILTYSCESALVQDNVIKLDGQVQPMKHFYTNGVRTSGNMTPDGELLLSYNGETGSHADDLELKIQGDLEEVELLAFLKS